MKKLLVVGVCLGWFGTAGVVAQDKPGSGAEERIELAKRIYRERILYGLERRSDPLPPSPPRLPEEAEDPLLNERTAEDLHSWSVRWMEAECDAATDRAGRLAAAQGHLRRMKALESGTLARDELADHPYIKELVEKKSTILVISADQLRKVDKHMLSVASRRFPDMARYFRLEAEARLAREQAGR
jgi:hypothetical protein